MKFIVQHLLNLKSEQRSLWVEEMKRYIPDIEIFPSVNGFDEAETQKELANTGVPFIHLQHHNYGSLACWVTKYKCLQKQVDQQIPEMCMIEDDVELDETFVCSVNALKKRFLEDPDLNMIRLARWGEGYITTLESAKRILALLKEEGVTGNIDNQLRGNCGKEVVIPIIHNVRVAANCGDIPGTSGLPREFAFIAGNNYQQALINPKPSLTIKSQSIQPHKATTKNETITTIHTEKTA